MTAKLLLFAILACVSVAGLMTYANAAEFEEGHWSEVMFMYRGFDHATTARDSTHCWQYFQIWNPDNKTIIYDDGYVFNSTERDGNWDIIRHDEGEDCLDRTIYRLTADGHTTHFSAESVAGGVIQLFEYHEDKFEAQNSTLADMQRQIDKNSKWIDKLKDRLSNKQDTIDSLKDKVKDQRKRIVELESMVEDHAIVLADGDLDDEGTVSQTLSN